MKFRMKISCIAFENAMSVKQLFFETILKIYMIMFKNNKISMRIEDTINQQDIVFNTILESPIKDCFNYLVILNSS
jgi:hypothetical protein